MQLHRDIRRTNTWLTAVIETANSEIECMISDMTIDCARLLVPTYVPDRFRLMIPTEDVTYDAEVIWRRDDRIGTRFIW